MKKVLALILVGIMIASFVGCEKSNNTTDNSESNKLEGVNAPIDILNAVWSSYSDEEKFPIMGGDFNVDNLVDGAPGVFDITDKNALGAQLVCGEEAAKMVECAASFTHSMNSNIFTGAAYRLKKADDSDKFSTLMLDSLKNNTWICGSPDKVMVAELTDGYVVVSFGQDGDGEIFTTFKDKLKKIYNFADIKVDSIQ
ncbi:MAG: hypothetical protein E7593_01960 [Ruminococcaceae bacterium]|nr:hypothetical protein [Oscillospiraceae bacterium]